MSPFQGVGSVLIAHPLSWLGEMQHKEFGNGSADIDQPLDRCIMVKSVADAIPCVSSSRRQLQPSL